MRRVQASDRALHASEHNRAPPPGFLPCSQLRCYSGQVDTAVVSTLNTSQRCYSIHRSRPVRHPSCCAMRRRALTRLCSMAAQPPLRKAPARRNGISRRLLLLRRLLYRYLQGLSSSDLRLLFHRNAASGRDSAHRVPRAPKRAGRSYAVFLGGLRRERTASEEPMSVIQTIETADGTRTPTSAKCSFASR